MLVSFGREQTFLKRDKDDTDLTQDYVGKKSVDPAWSLGIAENISVLYGINSLRKNI